MIMLLHRSREGWSGIMRRLAFVVALVCVTACGSPEGASDEGLAADTIDPMADATSPETPDAAVSAPAPDATPNDTAQPDAGPSQADSGSADASTAPPPEPVIIRTPPVTPEPGTPPPEPVVTKIPDFYLQRWIAIDHWAPNGGSLHFLLTISPSSAGIDNFDLYRVDNGVTTIDPVSPGLVASGKASTADWPVWHGITQGGGEFPTPVGYIDLLITFDPDTKTITKADLSGYFSHDPNRTTTAKLLPAS